MINSRTRLAGILAGTAALAIAVGGGTAFADRDHPEDGPHHGTVANAGALKHFDGTVLSKQRSPKQFTLRTEGGQKRTFRVNAGTNFERLSGFGALDRGLAVQVDAKRTERGLVARKVETAGGGGGGGGGGSDDGPNHT